MKNKTLAVLIGAVGSAFVLGGCSNDPVSASMEESSTSVGFNSSNPWVWTWKDTGPVGGTSTLALDIGCGYPATSCPSTSPMTVWCVGNDGRPYYMNNGVWTVDSRYFNTRDGNAIRIDVGVGQASYNTQPYLVSASGLVYGRSSDGSGWYAVGGSNKQAKDIAIGKFSAANAVWMVGADKAVYYIAPGPTWKSVGVCGAIRISVGSDNLPWIVDDQYRILKRTSVGGTWEEKSGRLASDIACGGTGSGQVWIIEQGTSKLYQWINNVWVYKQPTVTNNAVGIAVQGKTPQWDPQGPNYGTSSPWVVHNGGNQISYGSNYP